MEAHEHTKAVLNRLSRTIGQLSAVRRMVEQGRDCSDILIQLSAVRAQIAGISKVILKDHIDHCLPAALRAQDEETVAALKEAIERWV